MKLGIVGLPNVGKSTLFNAITHSQVEAENYPFATIEPNVGVVTVPDERLDVIAEIHDSKKIVPATIEFYDIAGLVKGASEGEGLGNQFLSNIREVDAIVHVVRCFEDQDIMHVDGTIDPKRDIETINTELIFSDLELLEKRQSKLQKTVKGDKSFLRELNLTNMLIEKLSKEESIRDLEYSEEDKKILRGFNLLSMKKVIYAANVSEDSIGQEDDELVKVVREIADNEGSKVVKISAEIESQIAQLDEEDGKLFLEELGLKESGLDRLIKSSYSLLGLISFLTTGPDETRAWTVKEGTKAQKAAGKIHSDMERGFIRAEVISYEELKELGSTAKARDKGKIRSEGKDYIMKDGDVVLFRFNV